MTTRILLAPSADLARQTLSDESVLLTVEAEYGSFVAEGAAYTAAHHQPVGSPWAGRHITEGGRPSPCNDPDIKPGVADDGVVLLSHVDLDTFGGCLRALHGWRDLFGPEHASFWALAEWVDVRGAHKLGQSDASETDIARLHAFWAWAKRCVPRLPRDQVVDVSALVHDAGLALADILADHPGLLAEGESLKASETDLNRRTFVRREGGIIVRTGTDFCNHLYADPSGTPAHAVVCYNSGHGSVTLSLAEPDAHPGVSCRDVAQGLWGPEAGGHAGIAGSPREKDMGLEGLEAAVAALREAIA